MNTKEILKEIGARTNGDVYLGIVGPVRVGKSTFIKRFMELSVIPEMKDEYERSRAIDELPQSGQGRTIMTTEPKFVPNTAATINIDEELNVKVRLVDCVGYVFPEAKGYKEDDDIRMVKTPWFEDPIPFNEAAKLGTQKVIQDHSTIGVVVTSDGSVVDIERTAYLKPEQEVIEELLKIGKPFVVVVNTTDPNGQSALNTVSYLKGKYQVPIIAIAIERMTAEDISSILKEALFEFPVARIDIGLAKWVAVLDENHWLKKSIKDSIQLSMKEARRVRDVENIGKVLKENTNITSSNIINVDTSTGVVSVGIEVPESLYEDIMKEIVGFEIGDKSELLAILQEYRKLKTEYEGISSAHLQARDAGYGFSLPGAGDIEIERPVLVKKGGRYGVKVKGKASTMHLIRVDVETSFEPIIGNKEQSEALLEYLIKDYEQDPKAIFASQIFGRNLGEMIKDGINGKMTLLPEHTKIKLQNIMKSLANKGKGNLIAIVF